MRHYCPRAESPSSFLISTYTKVTWTPSSHFPTDKKPAPCTICSTSSEKRAANSKCTPQLHDPTFILSSKKPTTFSHRGRDAHNPSEFGRPKSKPVGSQETLTSWHTNLPIRMLYGLTEGSPISCTILGDDYEFGKTATALTLAMMTCFEWKRRHGASETIEAWPTIVSSDGIGSCYS